jgi:chaperonin GroES
MNPEIEVSGDTATITSVPEKPFPFQPLSNYIVLELQEPKERVTGSGVIIPENVMQKTISTRVVAVSEDTDPTTGLSLVRTVKVGDNVIFDVRGGQLIDVEGEDYLVIRETELYGILKGEGGSLIQMPKSAKSAPKLYRPS